MAVVISSAAGDNGGAKLIESLTKQVEALKDKMREMHGESSKGNAKWLDEIKGLAKEYAGPVLALGSIAGAVHAVVSAHEEWSKKMNEIAAKHSQSNKDWVAMAARGGTAPLSNLNEVMARMSTVHATGEDKLAAFGGVASTARGASIDKLTEMSAIAAQQPGGTSGEFGSQLGAMSTVFKGKLSADQMARMLQFSRDKVAGSGEKFETDKFLRGVTEQVNKGVDPMQAWAIALQATVEHENVAKIFDQHGSFAGAMGMSGSGADLAGIRARAIAAMPDLEASKTKQPLLSEVMQKSVAGLQTGAEESQEIAIAKARKKLATEATRKSRLQAQVDLESELGSQQNGWFSNWLENALPLHDSRARRTIEIEMESGVQGAINIGREGQSRLRSGEWQKSRNQFIAEEKARRKAEDEQLEVMRTIARNQGAAGADPNRHSE
jgi:hypothetical protein